MSSHIVASGQVQAEFSESWFDLNEQRNPLDLQKFLQGFEILTNTPQLAKTQHLLVRHAFRKLNAANINSLQPAEQVNDVIEKFQRAWPKITVGKHTEYLPKSALEQMSPTFRAQLNSSMLPSNNITLDAPQNPNIADLVFHFLRTGEITINDENAKDLLTYSYAHQMVPLIEECEAYFKQNLSWDNFSTLLDLAPKKEYSERLNLVNFATELARHGLNLSISPEGQPAITFDSKFNSADSVSINLLGQINRLISIRCLGTNSHISLEELERIAAVLPDLEELILGRDLSREPRKISQADLSKLQGMLPKLRSFGDDTSFLQTFREVQDYLSLFGAPSQGGSSSGRLRLRSLNLLGIKDLTQEQIDSLSKYFGDLYHLLLKTDKVTQLDLPKATFIECRGCTALKSIVAPNAADGICDNCDALTSIAAPKAKSICCRNCSSLTTILALKATEVSCSRCPSLTTLSTPSARHIDCEACPALTTLEAPNAIKINCRFCNALTAVRAPKADMVDCEECKSLTTLDAPIFSDKTLATIRLIIANCNLDPRQKYLIPFKHGYYSKDRVEHSTSVSNGIFGVTLLNLFPAEYLHAGAKQRLSILNDIPYFNAMILDTAVSHGNSLMACKKYRQAIEEGKRVLAIDPNHKGAKRLAEEALETQLADKSYLNE